jgi:hypothetical protein
MKQKNFRKSIGFLIVLSAAMQFGCGATSPSNGALVGNGTAMLTVSPTTTVDFGLQIFNSLSSKTILIQHSGQGSVNVTSGNLAAPFAFNGGTYPGTGGTCGTTISADCTLEVIYQAPATACTSEASITLTYNDGSADRVITIHLLAKSAATTTTSFLNLWDEETSIGGSLFDFGTMTANYADPAIPGESMTHFFWLKNLSTSTALNLRTELALQNSTDESFYVGGSLGGSQNCIGLSELTAGQECWFGIVFTPMLEQAYQASLRVTYWNGNEDVVVSKGLAGTGGSPKD